ncbi:MAG: metal-dependent transcriptional regulator [Chloroflexi bacterium]|nr:metal-dependent transcriptional regulator [Chloroflexota bacterium]
MSRKLSDTVEDYLKVIYKLSVNSCRVSTGQIADALEVSPASVTDMVQRLANETPPLLDYVKHQGVALTDDGKTAALETIRHHRLLELFLHEVLGYSWDQVHAEADRLEHVISEEFEDRVAAVLGNPQRGLHGEPIPSRNLEMPDQDTCYLQDMRPGQLGTVHSVNDDDPGFLRFLEEQGLIPGAEFSVVGFSTYDDNLRLRIDGADEEIVLGASVTAQIQVEIKEKVTQI